MLYISSLINFNIFYTLFTVYDLKKPIPAIQSCTLHKWEKPTQTSMEHSPFREWCFPEFCPFLIQISCSKANWRPQAIMNHLMLISLIYFTQMETCKQQASVHLWLIVKLTCLLSATICIRRSHFRTTFFRYLHPLHFKTTERRKHSCWTPSFKSLFDLHLTAWLIRWCIFDYHQWCGSNIFEQTHFQP